MRTPALSLSESCRPPGAPPLDMLSATPLPLHIFRGETFLGLGWPSRHHPQGLPAVLRACLLKVRLCPLLPDGKRQIDVGRLVLGVPAIMGSTDVSSEYQLYPPMFWVHRMSTRQLSISAIIH